MRPVHLLTVVLAASLVTPGVARTERGSFLERPAWTQQKLIAQLKSDKKVMNRFKRHFGMNRQEVLEMAAGLSPGTLTATRSYWVYRADDKGVITATLRLFTKGTRVWVDADGTPILKMSCANPLVPGSSGLVTIKIEPYGEPKGLRPIKPTPYTVKVPVNQPLFPETVTPTPQLFNTQPPPTVIVTPEVEPGVIVGGGSSGGIGWIVPIGIIFPPPVPEPGTLLILGGGLGMLAASRMRKKSNR